MNNYSINLEYENAATEISDERRRKAIAARYRQATLIGNIEKRWGDDQHIATSFIAVIRDGVPTIPTDEKRRLSEFIHHVDSLLIGKSEAIYDVKLIDMMIYDQYSECEIARGVSNHFPEFEHHDVLAAVVKVRRDAITSGVLGSLWVEEDEEDESSFGIEHQENENPQDQAELIDLLRHWQPFISDDMCHKIIDVVSYLESIGMSAEVNDGVSVRKVQS